MHNHQEPGCALPGPNPAAQLLSEVQKAKTVLMVSVDYKRHEVFMDTQSPILPASNKTV